MLRRWCPVCKGVFACRVQRDGTLALVKHGFTMEVADFDPKRDSALDVQEKQQAGFCPGTGQRPWGEQEYRTWKRREQAQQ
ncbi:hypothetical protein [Roseicella aerolata]|uniref:Uncharacterized protein n=1 Tax=Roseicella aerolata TaxID=2883479 RepID=A0A9X1LDX5_9PROT|nr:hypothetical protein [Roseicella aerolata]MCB4825502.1 hypothetical protein [Roseicella aerolata]